MKGGISFYHHLEGRRLVRFEGSCAAPLSRQRDRRRRRRRLPPKPPARLRRSRLCRLHRHVVGSKTGMKLLSWPLAIPG
jgi:hypothetical protein